MPSSEPSPVPRRTAGHASLELLPGEPQARDLAREHLALLGRLEVGDDLGEAEEAHGDRDEADAVGELRDAEGEARDAGIDVGADEPSSRPRTIMAIALSSDPCASTTAPIRPSTMSEKYSAGPNLSASSASGGANAAISSVATRAGEERAEGRDRERRAGLALARHLVAVEAGDDRRRLARQVEQDRRRRAAVLRAVVDAGEHDQRRHRRQRVGHRQQHRDGRDRADAGQHADQRAEQDADEA